MKFRIVFITIFFSLTSLSNCADIITKPGDPVLGKEYNDFLAGVRKEQYDKYQASLKIDLKPLWSEQKLPCGCRIRVFLKELNSKQLLDHYMGQHKSKCKKMPVGQVIPVTLVSKAKQNSAQVVKPGVVKTSQINLDIQD